jgi:hypothetical protein
MVAVLGLSPALASAQSSSGGGTSGSGSSGSGSSSSPSSSSPSGTESPVDFSEFVSDPGHPGQHDPAGPTSSGPTTGAPGSSGSSSARRFTNKADCENAGADFLASDPAICHDLSTCA